MSAGQSKFEKPSALADMDSISNLYYYESVIDQSGRYEAGGAGSYCYYGEPALARLGGTEIANWVDTMMLHVRTQHPDAEDFRVSFANTVWRGCRDVSAIGTEICLRRISPTVPLLGDLTYTVPMAAEILESEFLNAGGLVIIGGLPGQGKTTTAGAIVATRLDRYSGRGVSVEDPSELDLEGFWGSGSLRQMSVDHDHPRPISRGVAGALRRALRLFPAARPAILYVGEVRDAETAVEVVKAALNGLLVITTTHCYDVTSAILRIKTLAESEMGAEAAAEALAQALRVVLHQQITFLPGQEGWKRAQFGGTILVSDGHTSQVANLIRTEKFNQIGQQVDFQRIRLGLAATKRMTATDALASISHEAR